MDSIPNVLPVILVDDITVLITLSLFFCFFKTFPDLTWNHMELAILDASAAAHVPDAP